MARISIARERYIIVRNNRTEVLCGLARHYHFVCLGDIKEVAIKTYRSKKQAEAAMECWSNYFTEGAEVVKVVETVVSLDG